MVLIAGVKTPLLTPEEVSSHLQEGEESHAFSQIPLILLLAHPHLF